MTTVAFVGLGQMGMPMSRNIAKAGFEVRVFDINPAAVEQAAKDGRQAADSAREAASGAEFVITMLPNGEHVEEAVFGKAGIAEAMAKEALYIDMSTILPTATDRIARRLGEAGIAMVDAPVGRTSAAAVTGTLLILAGGDAADVERARPVLLAMGEQIFHCGPVGAGARMKIVNNYMSSVLNTLTAETLVLAEACGLKRDLVVEILRGTPAGRGHLNTTYPNKVLKGDVSPEFMLDLAMKDIGLALETAAGSGVPLPTGAAARQFYVLAHQQGRGRQDWTAMLEAIRELAKLS